MPNEINLNKVRNYIYNIIYILNPVYEKVKNNPNPKKDFVNILISLYGSYYGPTFVDSDLISNLELLESRNTRNITNINSNPIIPDDEIDIIRDNIDNIISTYFNALDAHMDRGIDYQALVFNEINLHEALFDFISTIVNNTTFLKNIYNSFTRRPDSVSRNILGRNYTLTDNVNNINTEIRNYYQEIGQPVENSGIVNNLFVKNNQYINDELNIDSVRYSGLENINVNKCEDPVMRNKINIDEDSTKLYIVDKNNKIVRIYCLDEEAFNNYFKGKDNIFYRCKSDVPERAIFIQKHNIIEKPIRRLPFEFNVYSYENQTRKIKKGNSYVFKPTDELLGRIASHNVVTGSSVIGALHCQPAVGRDVIYSVKSYEPQIGGVRSKRKTMRNKKYRTKSGKSMKKRGYN